MRLAYLILAHANPAHLARLIARLSADDVWFYVHLDSKTDAAQFANVVHPRLVYSQRRVDCAWGDISLVEATLAVAREALDSGRPHEYFVLLSGACYPLHRPAAIDAFLTANRGRQFIEAFPMPDPAHGKPIERLTKYWIRKSAPLAGTKWRVQRLLNKVVVRDYVKGLDGAAPMAGSQWWSLSREALAYVVDFVRDHPRFYDFCRHTDCPDEFVFQTVLWQSPFRASISHSLSYTRWVAGGRGPQDIDDGDLARFAAPVVLDAESNNCPNDKREVLFARKFSDASGALLDRLDRIIDGRPGP